jgi:hypothetical protein
MSNPTTPFSWQMPTATDLVTDLPADFEVFGQAVATSMADLLGGTSGQILAKNSNTDMDFVWIANDQGDITGITATSPLTGGGTSGAVTVGIQDALTTQKGAVQLSDSTSTTSSILAATPTAVKAAYDLANGAIAQTTVTTAGDILYRNATVPVRLGIGTAGQVLQVNSGATAPEWATPEAAGGMTLLSTTSMSGSSITISSISQSYKNLVIEFANVTANADYTYRWQPNGNDDSSNILTTRSMNTTVTHMAIGTGSNWMIDNNYQFLSSNTTNKVTLTIFDYASTTSYKNYTLYGSAQRSTTQWLQAKESGTFLSNTALSSIGVVSGASFNGGTIKIYGVK